MDVHICAQRRVVFVEGERVGEIRKKGEKLMMFAEEIYPSLPLGQFKIVVLFEIFRFCIRRVRK